MHDVYRDRMDITEVFSRYAAALDERRWDRLAELYTPEATAEQPAGSPLLVGPEAIVDMISTAIDWLGPTHHSLSNHICEVDGDQATASCYVRGYHAGRGEHADKFEETLGRFSAKLARTPEGWRFTSFVEHITLMIGSTEIFNPSLLPGA
jgi:ketosteroid isomerase-like protein